MFFKQTSEVSLLLGALEDTEVAIGVHSDELLIGDLEIHPRSRKVLMKGSEVSLTPKEFDILYFLAKNLSLIHIWRNLISWLNQ